MKRHDNRLTRTCAASVLVAAGFAVTIACGSGASEGSPVANDLGLSDAGGLANATPEWVQLIGPQASFEGATTTAAGHVWVVGRFQGAKITAGTLEATGGDTFVARFNASGKAEFLTSLTTGASPALGRMSVVPLLDGAVVSVLGQLENFEATMKGSGYGLFLYQGDTLVEKRAIQAQGVYLGGGSGSSFALVVKDLSMLTGPTGSQTGPGHWFFRIAAGKTIESSRSLGDGLLVDAASSRNDGIEFIGWIGGFSPKVTVGGKARAHVLLSGTGETVFARELSGPFVPALPSLSAGASNTVLSAGFNAFFGPPEAATYNGVDISAPNSKKFGVAFEVDGSGQITRKVHLTDPDVAITATLPGAKGYALASRSGIALGGISTRGVIVTDSNFVPISTHAFESNGSAIRALAVDPAGGFFAVGEALGKLDDVPGVTFQSAVFVSRFLPR